jgi:hypothetical protein
MEGLSDGMRIVLMLFVTSNFMLVAIVALLSIHSNHAKENTKTLLALIEELHGFLRSEAKVLREDNKRIYLKIDEMEGILHDDLTNIPENKE